jgi:hypothetical protein
MDLNIRNFPEPLLSKLKLEALRRRCTLRDLVIESLEQVEFRWITKPATMPNDGSTRPEPASIVRASGGVSSDRREKTAIRPFQQPHWPQPGESQEAYEDRVDVEKPAEPALHELTVEKDDYSQV